MTAKHILVNRDIVRDDDLDLDLISLLNLELPCTQHKSDIMMQNLTLSRQYHNQSVIIKVHSHTNAECIV